MGLREGGSHHYGLSPLAGVTAGTAAVLFAFGVLALAWRRVAAQVAAGITVLVYVLIAVACGLAVAALFYVVLWLRHRVRHPETLARQAVARAEAAGEAPRAVEPAPHAAAIEPPRVYLNANPDQIAAALLRQQVTFTQLPGAVRGDEEGRGPR